MNDSPLRIVRKTQKKTLLEVATAIGCTVGHLSSIETGGVNASTDLAEKLVAYFGAENITEIKILYPERFVSSNSDTATPSRAVNG